MREAKENTDTILKFFFLMFNFITILFDCAGVIGLQRQLPGTSFVRNYCRDTVHTVLFWVSVVCFSPLLSSFRLKSRQEQFFTTFLIIN